MYVFNFFTEDSNLFVYDEKNKAAIESLKLSSEAKSAGRTFFKSATLNEGVKTLKAGSAFHFIAQSGVEAGEHELSEASPYKSTV